MKQALAEWDRLQAVKAAQEAALHERYELLREQIGDALSPVEDQSYYFTAARCGVNIQEITSSGGSAPRCVQTFV